MDSLPPMDWRELATKADLADLEQRLDTRFDKRIAKQTYVILAGAVAIASPFYIALVMALFAAPGG